MSQVFLASRYGASGFVKQVALKTLPPEHWDDERLTRALIEEARLGAQLSHRNLVQIYDLGVDEGIYYLCMEYVDGIDLRKVLAKGPLPPSLALMVGAEVALALATAHQASDQAGRALGVVHRDISASNILLSRRGEVKLTDFGIAKATLLSDATWGRFRKGTVAYMAPEQLAGEALTHHTDQFGLGVVIAEMISGTRPFDGPNVAATMEQLRAAKDPHLQGCPPAVRTLLKQMLSPTPTDRLKDMRATFEALAAIRTQYPAATSLDLMDFLQPILKETNTTNK